MKRPRKVRRWFDIFTNKPVDETTFLPLVMHPNDVECLPDNLMPRLTTWDRINLSNAHDPATCNKRQVFDSATAERNQLVRAGVRVSLDWETANYPLPVREDEAVSLTITINFYKTYLPTA